MDPDEAHEPQERAARVSSPGEGAPKRPTVAAAPALSPTAPSSPPYRRPPAESVGRPPETLP